MSSVPAAKMAVIPTDLNVKSGKVGWIFGAAVFLVSVPVFIQAPLVRQMPEIGLISTLGWLWLSIFLLKSKSKYIWGDLLLGFSWSWLAGGIYWGWLRWEPLLHLPVEAIGLPFAIWCLWHRRWQVGSWFYLGSLFGTAVTDLYFYIVELIPHWRKIMEVEPALAMPIFQSAIALVRTPWGLGWMVVLAGVLLIVGILPLRSPRGGITPYLHLWAFSGAVLSTIFVDSLFYLAACAA